jgi:hypothetical protein
MPVSSRREGVQIQREMGNNTLWGGGSTDEECMDHRKDGDFFSITIT